VVSYDGQLATSGITTVLDSLRVLARRWRRGGDGRQALLGKRSHRARSKLLLADHSCTWCESDAECGREAKELIDPPTAADVADGPPRGSASSATRQASRLLIAARRGKRRRLIAVREALPLQKTYARPTCAKSWPLRTI